MLEITLFKIFITQRDSFLSQKCNRINLHRLRPRLNVADESDSISPVNRAQILVARIDLAFGNWRAGAERGGY